MEIYGDLYALLNFLADGLLLLLAGKLQSRPLKKRRILLSAGVGGLYAFLSLFLPSYKPLLLFLSFAVSLLMVRIAYPYEGFRNYLLSCLFFYISAILLSGGLQLFLAAVGQVLSPLWASILLLFFLSAAFMFSLLFAEVLKRRQLHKKAELHFTYKGKSYSCSAFADSGNLLCDTETGLPVILLSDCFFAETPEDTDRFVLVKTVTSSRFLPLFTPASLFVNGKEKRALLAKADSVKDFGGCPALLPTELLL